MINDETIKYVAALAKLDLSEKDAKQAEIDLSKIIDYVNRMNELDTTEIEPMSHIFAYDNVFREDMASNQPQRDSILSNAPEKKDGGFKVPKTVE